MLRLNGSLPHQRQASRGVTPCQAALHQVHAGVQRKLLAGHHHASDATPHRYILQRIQNFTWSVKKTKVKIVGPVVPGLSLTSTRNCVNLRANSLRTSEFSKIAAKLPLTILGDMGELASSKLEPKSAFFSRVSKITVRIFLSLNVVGIYLFSETRTSSETERGMRQTPICTARARDGRK